jgi:hypothetical protein
MHLPGTPRIAVYGAWLLFVLPMHAQCTFCKHISNRIKEPGIERPKFSNAHSIANLNPLISLVINMCAIEQVRSINTGLLSTLEAIR